MIVVDGDPDIRYTVRSMLRQYGFTVLEAESAGQAARIAQEYEGRIDLAVVDDSIKDADGRSAISRIREEQQAVRALHYSDEPKEELQRTGRIAQDAAYVQKPFRVDQFITKVHEALGWLPERRRTSGGSG